VKADWVDAIPRRPKHLKGIMEAQCGWITLTNWGEEAAKILSGRIISIF